MSGYADACVYVVRANVLDKKGLRVITDLEKGKRMENLGIVVNGIKMSRPVVTDDGYGYGYGYGCDYGYGQDAGEKKGKKRKSTK